MSLHLQENMYEADEREMDGRMLAKIGGHRERSRGK